MVNLIVNFNINYMIDRINKYFLLLIFLKDYIMNGINYKFKVKLTTC